jgi:hypothetical protein
MTEIAPDNIIQLQMVKSLNYLKNNGEDPLHSIVMFDFREGLDEWLTWGLMQDQRHKVF